MFTGTHNSILALLLLPLIIKAVKSYKVGEVTVTLTKKQIADSFILQIKVRKNKYIPFNFLRAITL